MVVSCPRWMREPTKPKSYLNDPVVGAGPRTPAHLREDGCDLRSQHDYLLKNPQTI